ncbi:hypothetical protein PPERSA_05025 [Pseudocohnilembus persalinus]|uniref:Ion transport domain-containing protein n=1 Tax=Pseudocohnilembus persalinus TaxID=266149 RepID=A0A0V0QVN2_PSEPJ|nr:hypothetical protein PPERSA_05025 [Pseudocohnilembus persalinus]|eukprot:KRX06412.1 hypothetical protein PPERSA_05025 [Pseudocohnilembus persalinus]
MEIQATLPFLNQSVYGEQIDTYLQEMIKLYCLMTYKIEQQGWWSKLRLKVLQFIRSTKFEVIIASIIILNCIMNALDNPLSNPDKAYKQILKNLDYIVTFIYTVEAIIKIIAYRFIVGRFAYIRDAWNCIDFCVLLISLSSYGTDNGLGIFKALRALRLLKISQYLSGLKLVMISLGKSAKMLFHLCIFAFAVSLVVGLIPVKFLKGSYYYCTNLDDSVNSDFIVTKYDCLDFGGDWINQDFNWDNIVSGLFNLFIIATCEGWTAFQYLAWQAKGVDLEPVKGNNKNWTIFFIAYFIVGNLMVFNTFIGVLIEKFNYIKKLVFRTKININTYYPGKEISGMINKYLFNENKIK